MLYSRSVRNACKTFVCYRTSNMMLLRAYLGYAENNPAIQINLFWLSTVFPLIPLDAGGTAYTGSFAHPGRRAA